MATSLPADIIMAEEMLVAKIRDIIEQNPIVQGRVKVHTRERYPDSDKEDLELTTVPDPVSQNAEVTSIIEIGIPSVLVQQYTNDQHIQIDFTYPIMFNHDIVDKWDTKGSDFPFTNSRSFVMAVYLKTMILLNEDRTLGFNNCVHDYLQQPVAGTAGEEGSGGLLHSLEWSLTVKISGIFS